MAETLAPSILAALCSHEAYPDDPSAAAGVDHIQTHLSHLFLTPDRVYKLRKPVRFGFVDFSSLEERNADCVREVALNRRMTHAVYLGLAPLHVDAPVRIGRLSEQPREGSEHVVVMRRLPSGRDALSLLERGALSPELIDRIARHVAAFHDATGLGRPAPFAAATWLESIEGPVRDNFDALSGALGPDHALLRTCSERAGALGTAHRNRLEARRREGFAVDGHGDLHLQHVWLDEDENLQVIDCLEFDDALRRIDAAADVAFLVMDLVYRGRADLGARLARVYAAARDDYGMYGVLDYYVSYRAAVRAKVAGLAAQDPALPADQRTRALRSAESHLELAASALTERERGSVVAVCGSIGTGKSTAARTIADASRGVIIASDRVRKHVAGLAPEEHRADAWGAGLYTPEQKAAIYRGLLERAEPVIESGRTAILDATYASSAQRSELLRWARERGVSARLIEVTCDPALARERLEARQRERKDPSDAGPELLEASLASFEPPAEWPSDARVRVDTGKDSWREELASATRAWDLGSGAS
jgi:aminoglycoside phosphotransferase family enzyme/predicted kinase